MRRLRWSDGDYDEGGAYWGGGSGDFIYWAYGEIRDFNPISGGVTEIEVFVRSTTRKKAKEAVRLHLPGARFYN